MIRKIVSAFCIITMLIIISVQAISIKIEIRDTYSIISTESNTYLISIDYDKLYQLDDNIFYYEDTSYSFEIIKIVETINTDDKYYQIIEISLSDDFKLDDDLINIQLFKEFLPIYQVVFDSITRRNYE